MPKFAAGELEKYVIAIFEAVGSSPVEASTVGQHLIDANLTGHDSHGVLRVPQYIKAVQSGKVMLNARPNVISETDSTATLDGQNGFGQVIATEAMTLAVRKAQQCGISAVAFCNSYHSGRIASYIKIAAAAGWPRILCPSRSLRAMVTRSCWTLRPAWRRKAKSAIITKKGNRSRWAG